MAEDLTVPKEATRRKDAEPPNAMDVSEDLTLPNGRPAAFRVECNVDGDMSLSVPAAHPVFTVWQRFRRRGEDQLVDSMQVVCGEGHDGTVTVLILVLLP